MGFIVDLPDARIVDLAALHDYISTTNPIPSAGELIEKGYIPLIEAGIIVVDTSGQLQWGLDASGQKLVIEANSATPAYWMPRLGKLPFISSPTFDGLTTDEDELTKLAKIINVTPITLVNGALTNVELLPAVASYYGVIEILGNYVSAAVDGNDHTAIFVDEDDIDLLGAPPSITMDADADEFHTKQKGMIMRGTVANKALDVDVDTGGGAGDNGKIIYLVYLAHYTK